MASFVIAGKADDPSFARAEYAAGQVQALVPNIYVKLEMKHPDHWKSFINSICRTYDFWSFAEDFSGPLVWTLEGELIGGGADFVQKICLEKFGIPEVPAVTDPVFKEIAAENLKKVKLQLQREQFGPPLPERVTAAHLIAKELELCQPQQLVEQKKIVSSGAALEVWLNPTLLLDAENCEASGASAQRIDARLKICKVGQEESHLAMLHPRPVVPKHIVLVPGRFVEEVTEAQLAQEEAKAEESPEAAPEALPEAPQDMQQEQELPPAPPVPSKVVQLGIPPHRIRTEPQEDLSLADFTAAMEILSQVGGLATWSAIRTGSEYRLPLETHLQVLPFPLGCQGSNQRFPLESYLERLQKEKEKEVPDSLPIFPFKHVLMPIPAPAVADGKASPVEYAKPAALTYDAALLKLNGSRQGGSMLLAFTTSWMLMAELTPPEVGSPEHEVWLRLPPLHPCAFFGFVICPPVEIGFPETAGGRLSQNKLVSNRAAEEGITEDAPDFEKAKKEVRVSFQIYSRPTETMGYWVSK